MILTGKALDDFEFYLFERQYPEEYYQRDFMSKTCINSIITEWFDSVGIYINIGGVIIDCISEFSFDIQQNNTLNGIDSYGFNSRQEATEKAILKANEIYNERTNISDKI